MNIYISWLLLGVGERIFQTVDPHVAPQHSQRLPRL